MYERILFPLNGSNRAELAPPFAEEPAAEPGSEITLLCVSDPAEAENYARHEIYLEQITEIARRAAEKLLTNPEHKVNIKPAVTIGLPNQEIVDFSEQLAVSLIIMATHDRTGASVFRANQIADQ